MLLSVNNASKTLEIRNDSIGLEFRKLAVHLIALQDPVQCEYSGLDLLAKSGLIQSISHRKLVMLKLR